METILGLLLILLPAIFKLVEKKLKASGNMEAAEKVGEWSELFGEEKEDQEEGEDAIPASPIFPQPVVPVSEPLRPEQMRPEPMRPEPVQHKPVSRRTRKTSSKPILVEEEPKKKEKIDPKKLVIYSEIMNPKF